MFRVVVAFEDVGQFDDFVSAFRLFYEKVKEMVRAGSSWQVLETMCFIVYVGKDHRIPMGFYDARDFAYSIGLLAGNGELQDIAPPAEGLVEATFLGVAAHEIDEQLQFVLKQLDEVCGSLGTIEACPILSEASE